MGSDPISVHREERGLPISGGGSGTASDEEHFARGGPQRAFEVAPERVLELETRLQEQELQFAGEIHVALEIAHVPVQGVIRGEAVGEVSCSRS